MTPALQRLFAYACLAVSMSLVGSYVALSRPLVAAMPVFLLAWLRFAIGGVGMLHWLRKPASEPPWTPQTRGLVFLESFLGNFLFTICMLFGVSLSSAVSAGVIMASIPAAIAVLSWAFLRERIAPRIWAAIGCAALGIALLGMSHADAAAAAPSAELAAGSRNAWLGNVLVFCAVLCEASYAVIGKKLTGTLGPKRITALINLWGFALMTPFGAYAALHFDFASVRPGTWMLLVFYSLAASVWTVWLWMTGSRIVHAAEAGVFTVMLPVTAAFVGVFVLGEPLSGTQMTAFSLALAGILLATLPVKSSL